jgi:hypothetical protein
MDPVEMPLGKCVGLAPGPAARNRDAHASIVIDAQQVPARADVADEVDVGGSQRRGSMRLRLAFERQTKLHPATG